MTKQSLLFAGAMPMGGIAELKRRKQEKELAERGGAEAAQAEEEAEEEKPSETAVEQQPGQLKHVSLRTRNFHFVVKKDDT